MSGETLCDAPARLRLRVISSLILYLSILCYPLVFMLKALSSTVLLPVLQGQPDRGQVLIRLTWVLGI